MKISKPNIISFACKTNSNHFNYFLGDQLSVQTDCIEGLGLMLDSKLHFHRHVGYLGSHALKLLVLMRFIMYNISSFDRLKVLYVALILS
jgi:hypothetical protein